MTKHPPMRVVGSETQSYEAQPRCTGIQRVIRATHTGLDDVLRAQGVALAPFHTRKADRSTHFLRDPYLAGDPLLHRSPVPMEALSALLLLDLNTHMDFRPIRELKASRNTPVIALVHDVLPIIKPQWFPDHSYRHFRVYLQQVLSVADHLILTSDKVRTDVEGLGWNIRPTIHVLHLGSHFPPVEPVRFPDGRLSMLYVSTVGPRKGHDLLLKAFDLLDERGHDVSLCLVGAPGFDVELNARVQGHPALGGRLRWLHNADDQRIRAVARSCNVAVVPPEDEGFGLFLEEGLTLGLKVVATDIPVLREREQPNVTFADQTPEGLADAILRAHHTDWVSPARPTRTMNDFSAELAILINEIIHR